MVFSKKTNRKSKRKTKCNLQRKKLVKQSGGASLYESIKALNHSLPNSVPVSQRESTRVKHFYTAESFHDKADEKYTEAYFKEFNINSKLRNKYNLAVAKKKPTQTANTSNGLELTELNYAPTITHSQYIADITLRPYYKEEHYRTLLPDEDLQEKYDTFKALVYTKPTATITVDQFELFIDQDLHKLWKLYKRHDNTYKYTHVPYFIDNELFDKLSTEFEHKTKNPMHSFTGNILKRDDSSNQKMLYFIPELFNREEFITVQKLIMQNQTIMDYEYKILDYDQQKLFTQNKENLEQYNKREQSAKQSVKLTATQSERIPDVQELLKLKQTMTKAEYNHLTVPFPKIKEFITKRKTAEIWNLTDREKFVKYLSSIMPPELHEVIVNPFTIYDITTDDNILKNLGLYLENAAAASTAE